MNAISDRELNLFCAAWAIFGLIVGAGIVGLYAAATMVMRSKYDAKVTDCNVANDQVKLVTAQRDELQKQIDAHKPDSDPTPFRIGGRPTLIAVKTAAEHAARNGKGVTARPVTV